MPEKYASALTYLTRVESLIRTIGAPKDDTSIALVPISTQQYWALVAVAKVANLTIRRAKTQWKRKRT